MKNTIESLAVITAGAAALFAALGAAMILPAFILSLLK
jgi:hypothetical protein